MGDTFCPAGGFKVSTITRVRCAWGKFRSLLPLLTCRAIPIKRRGKLYLSCVRSTMLHASECWALRKEDLNRLIRNERAMLRWMCNIQPHLRISIKILYSRLGIPNLTSALRLNRLRWFGHVQRSNAWINHITNFQVDGTRPKGRPKKSWSDVVREDIAEWYINKESVMDRNIWKENLRLAMKSPTRGNSGQVA